MLPNPSLSSRALGSSVYERGCDASGKDASSLPVFHDPHVGAAVSRL